MLPHNDSAEGITENDSLIVNIQEQGSASGNSSQEGPTVNINIAQKTSSGKLETIFDWTGSITTLFAMIPQGIFGGLLTDRLMRDNKLPIGFRIPGMIIIAITAEEGKRRLLRYFNQNDFKHLDQFIKDLHPRNWSVPNIISAILTVAVSSVFVYLASLSWDQGGDLLLQYNNTYTNTTADVVTNIGFKSPFMISAGLTNLLGFPNIMRGFYSLLRQGGYYMVENPNYRRQRDLLTRHLKSVRRDWIKAISERGSDQANMELLARLVASSQGSDINELLLQQLETLRDQDGLHSKLLEISNSGHEVISRESWLSWIAKHVSGLGLSAIAITGMFNFQDMGEDALKAADLDVVAPVGGWLIYMGMSIMMFTIIDGMALDIAARMNGQQPSLNVQSLGRRIFIIGSALTVCILGGTPNAEQSFIARESVAMNIFAAVGSFLAEIYGYYQLTSDNANEKISKKDPQRAFLLAVDKILRENEDLSKLAPGDMQELMRELMRHQQESSEDEDNLLLQQQPLVVNNISQYRSSYTWAAEKASGIKTSIKDSLCCCFYGRSREQVEPINADIMDDEAIHRSISRTQPRRRCCTIL